MSVDVRISEKKLQQFHHRSYEYHGDNGSESKPQKTTTQTIRNEGMNETLM